MFNLESIVQNISLERLFEMESTFYGNHRWKRHSENSEEEPPRKRPLHALTDRDGRSLLHHAAIRGDVPRMRELITRGSDTRLRDSWGKTPLHSALWAGKEEAVDLLAEEDPENDVQDMLGCTPLHCAAFEGHLGAVRRLLSGGARTQIQNRWGQTPPHWALDCGAEAAAELIAEVDDIISLPDDRGRTPLHCAADGGFRAMVATLLNNDVNPHIQDNEGEYPFRLALRRGRHEDIAKMILSSYALLDFVVDWGELELSPDELQFCVEEISRCSEEIRLMKRTRVGLSSVSYHDLVTRHVTWAVPPVPSEGDRSVELRDRWERDFPHYAHRISLRLRPAGERRARMDRCRRCFSLLPPELTPFPVTCSDVVLRCLRDGDMENFISAVQFPPQK